MDKERKRELSARIKAHRKYRGLTQEQAAEQVGITYSSYVKIENAFQTPSLSTLVKISEVLDVSLDWLVFGRG
ncbi:helix-turn-helix transcriptional regulator [Oscillospiraceae bacterium 50-16]